MDIISITVGFLIGTATGAAGKYFSDKYTDQRREKKAAKEELRLWTEIEHRFPALIAEMRQDFNDPEHVGVRVFFVRPSTSLIGLKQEPSFDYFTDEHQELMAAIKYLEENGFIQEITPGNCPMYRAKERLVDRLRRPNNSFKPTPHRGSSHVHTLR
jgi:hypothetical protein